MENGHLREERAIEKCLIDLDPTLNFSENAKPQLSQIDKSSDGYEEGQFEFTLVTNDGFVGSIRVAGQGSSTSMYQNPSVSHS